MISALVSAYYAPEFIEGRMQNLMGEGLEVVVVCQKGSYEHEVVSKYPCVLITTEDVPPLSEAWNMGIAMSGGEYLTSANCDDRLYPGKMKELADYLDAHPECAIVHGDADLQVGERVSPWKRKGPSVSPTHCTVGPFPLWRKSLHEKYGYFEPGMIVCQDFEFWLRCQYFGERIDHIDSVTGIFLKRDNNIGGKNLAQWMREKEVIKERYEN